MNQRDRHSMPSFACYLCTNPIVAANMSDEHIIPNALGGVLRSRALVCAPCNAKLGHEVDADLCNYVAPLGVLIGVRRDAGTGRAVPIRRADGSVLLLDHAGRLRTPQPRFVETPAERSVDIAVTASTKREAEKTFAGLVRKWSKKFDKVEIAPVRESTVELDEQMHFKLEARGPATNRAVAKIALSYYLHVGGDQSHVTDIIEYIRSGARAEPVDAHWYGGPDVLPAEGDALLRHVVAVRGSAAEGRLVGYVELFGSLHFAVVLAQPYDGPTVSRAHVVTLIDRAATDLDARALAGFPWPIAGSASAAALTRGLTEVMRRANELAASRRFDRMWGAMVDGAIRRAMATCANGRTEVPTAELWPHLARELQPWIEAYGRDLVDRRRRREALRSASAPEAPESDAADEDREVTGDDPVDEP